MRERAANDLLPAACLLAIYAGFAAHLLFPDQILITLIAALLGAVLGMLLGVGEDAENIIHEPGRSVAPSPARSSSHGNGAPWS